MDNPYGPPGVSPEDEQALMLRFLQLAGVQPQQAPQMEESPGIHIGRFGVSGNRLDSISRAVLAAMQNQPRATGGGAGFAQGFAQGFSGSRVRAADERKARYEAAQKDAQDRREWARRVQQSGAEIMLRQRAEGMFPNAGTATQKPNEAYIVLDTPEKEAAFKAQFPHVDVPPDKTVMRSWLKSDEGTDLNNQIKAERLRNLKENIPKGLSPKAINFWTEHVLSGGDLPQWVATRDPQARRALAENAAEEASKTGMSGYDLARARAAFKAEASALTDVTRTAENARPFINLLHTNMDVLMNTAQKIKDTGTAWGNVPVRQLVVGLGSKDQVAFNTALLPVVTEAARVLTSPNMRGVLTDDARHELESVVSRNFTMAQLEGAIEILRLESNNRLDAYDEAVSSIKGKLGVAPGAEAAAPPATNVARAPSLGDRALEEISKLARRKK